jgi:serine phosphatase RsbU (regulator of sigma subunit)
VAEVIEQVRDQGAAQICAHVLATVKDYRGSRQDQDDVTVMVIKTVGLEVLRS